VPATARHRPGPARPACPGRAARLSLRRALSSRLTGVPRALSAPTADAPRRPCHVHAPSPPG
jgi:hypothetical protein